MSEKRSNQKKVREFSGKLKFLALKMHVYHIYAVLDFCQLDN